jgi:hypothetical protein
MAPGRAWTAAIAGSRLPGSADRALGHTEQRTSSEQQGFTNIGHGVDADRGRSREAGFGHHLTKPADLDALDRVLAAVAEAKRGARLQT